MAAVAAVVLVAGVGLQPLAVLGKAAPGAPDSGRWIGLALIVLGISIAVVVFIRGLATLAWPTRRPAGGRALENVHPSVDLLEAHSGEREPPTFRVVALGLEGSGKTVLLASQFHVLKEPTGDSRFFLDGDLRQDQELFGHFGDTHAPWPAGSQLGDIREFMFDCKAHDSAGAVRTVFRISYLDYAGDLLEPGVKHEEAGDLLELGVGHEEAGKIEAKVKQAHALLVIIDGRRVLQLLAGDREGDRYFDVRLQPLLLLAGRASCPIQLIVTKWDLLHRPGESSNGGESRLHEVMACLEPKLKIEHLVRGSHAQKARLIPVSAVGQDFVTVLDDGSVVKRPGGMLAPVNAQVPLCAVLPDAIKQAEQSLADQPNVRQEVLDEVRRTRPGGASAIVRSVLDSPAGTLLKRTLSGFVGEAVVRLIVEALVPKKPAEEPPPPGSAAVDADVGLRAAVIDDMKHIVLLLEARLPSSKLRKRW